jgi:hypothetical protein
MAVITGHAVRRLQERLPDLQDPADWLEDALVRAEENGSYRRQEGSGNYLVRALAGNVRAELVVALTNRCVTLVTVLVYERQAPERRRDVTRQRNRKGNFSGSISRTSAGYPRR